jgi:hypothetical protein
MLRFTRRSAPQPGLRFCDSCAEVSTTAERARRRFERTRAELTAVTGPR